MLRYAERVVGFETESDATRRRAVMSALNIQNISEWRIERWIKAAINDRNFARARQMLKKYRQAVERDEWQVRRDLAEARNRACIRNQ